LCPGCQDGPEGKPICPRCQRDVLDALEWLAESGQPYRGNDPTLAAAELAQ